VTVIDHSKEEEAPAEQNPPEASSATPVEEMDPFRADVFSRIDIVAADPGPFKALIYGPKGAGKTVFTARAKNCLFIAGEPGQRSLLNHQDTRRVPVLRVKSFNDIDEIVWAKRDGSLDELLAKKDLPPVETFVIDTVSELSNTAASELLDRAVAADPKRNRFLVSQAEYKVRNELFRRLTGEWTNLGVNIILTAHESEVKDEGDGHFYYRPSVSETMAEMLGGWVDLQGRLTREDSEDPNEFVNILQVHPTRRVDAKTRVGGLPLAIRNPDINALIAANQSVAA
jgi:hypothetical protein